MTGRKWYETSYRRNLVDMHIEGWNEEFLSRFDPADYVEQLKKAKIQSAMIYANSHVGYCYWPTETGRMHGGLRGRDILGELTGLCHREGMDVVFYYTLVYNNWAYDRDESWRIIRNDGKAPREVAPWGIWGGRYGVCCPNSEGYREFTAKQLQELCKGYDFEGVFLDMTFWPGVCYCPSCKARYERETGGEIPKEINWSDPEWIRFQKKREEWISEFAAFTTGVVTGCKPEVSVEHQFSGAPTSWSRATTLGIAEASDYAGGDLYGGFLEQSFVCKLYRSLTTHQPFEYMTSRCDPDLRDHTTMKSKEAMELHASLALAHQGAFLFIDAINPVGTLNPKAYEMMGEIFSKTRDLEKYMGGNPVQDVCIYFSLKSKFDPHETGQDINRVSDEHPHLAAALGAAETLREYHIPYGVISEKNLSDLASCRVLVLPGVFVLGEKEAEAIRSFVMNGGGLYVSGSTCSGMLEDVLGIRYEGVTRERVTYIAPAESGQLLMPGIDKDAPLTLFSPQLLVSAFNRNEVMATTVLPYTDPADYTRFASIHSNPPGIATDNPAVLMRTCGKGRVMWVAAPLEASRKMPHKRIFHEMLKNLAACPFTIESDAPGVVEIIAFEQVERQRYILSIVNEQDQMPPNPVRDMTIRLRHHDKKVTKVLVLPEEVLLDFEPGETDTLIMVPPLQIFQMLAVCYE